MSVVNSDGMMAKGGNGSTPRTPGTKLTLSITNGYQHATPKANFPTVQMCCSTFVSLLSLLGILACEKLTV